MQELLNQLQEMEIEIQGWHYRGMPIARGDILTARPAPEGAAAATAAAAH